MAAVSEGFGAYSRDAKVPVFKDGRPNPRAYRQISAGSIFGRWSLCLDMCVGWGGGEKVGGSRGGDGARNASGEEEVRMALWLFANALVTIGLLGGVAVSTFSKTLAMLFGLLVFGVQVCRCSHGKGDKQCSCSHSIWLRKDTTSYRRPDCSDT